MEYEYTMNKRCEIGGEVTLTILVSANNGSGCCQIDAFEQPVDCNKKKDCPGGAKCLLKEINMDDDFNLWAQY